MSKFTVYSLLAVICSVVVLGRAEDVTTPKPVTIIPPHHTLNDSKVPVITTVNETTSLAPDLSTIQSSTHVDTKHTTTTTVKPTTTPTTTTSSSTTPPPAPPSTTTPKPQPQPKPEQGTWWYTNTTSNVTCVLVQFAAQLNVSYTMIDQNNGTKMGYVQLTVPKDAKVVNGSCGETRQWLKIQWASDNDTQINNMTMAFKKNGTQQYLQFFKVSLSPKQFVNAAPNSTFELLHNGSDWMTPVSTSYRCNPPSKLKLNGSQTVPIAEISLSELQVEAFRSSSDKNFSVARECGSGDLPDAVPIAVGCALGGMVAVVLIAYLVGRRRSAARGYLSM